MTQITKKITYIALAVSFLTLLFTGMQMSASKAELNPLEESVIGEFEVAHLKVNISENGSITNQSILTDLGESVEPGKSYREELAAVNSTDMEEYVRVIVRKYWMNANGEKQADLDPSLIVLSYNEAEYNQDAWIRNDKECTAEKEVYYLRRALGGYASSASLFREFHIDSSIMQKYHTETSGNTVTQVYSYDNCSFIVEVEVQSVQASHAQEAITSVWGVRNVSIADDGSVIVR